MDTGRLKRFATEARNILMQGVAHRFTALGFLPDGNVTEEPLPMGGGATFMGDTVSEDFYKKWCSLQHAVKRHSIEEVAEEAAYTWFNRMVAIRIMVKNGLIAPVLQYESEGVHIPLLVSEARQGRMPDMNVDNKRKLEDLLLDDSKTDEQFRILIVAFCHANPVINNCFGHISDYTELLLPTNILAEGGFVDMLNNTEFISEEDYHSPELIGWLYQFYISEKKDDVFASFKKGKKAEAKDIPAATQIFTPNWIVKYMVQNTIGRIYLDNNPYEEDVQKNWKYLVEPSEPTPKENILHYDNLTELKFADLASGSGHILNEGFDMLYDLYVLEGYSRSQAIENIFRYNLTGVDIDTRAKQLAQFALLLKACQKDSSFADAHIMPRVLDMPEPYPYKDNLRDTLPHFLIGSNQQMTQEIIDAIELMDQAKNLGSIMSFNLSESTRNAIAARMKEYNQQTSYSDEFEQLKMRMQLLLVLTDKYSSLIANPPYMGRANMNSKLADYLDLNYPDVKQDLFATFMQMMIDKTLDNGRTAFITMESWMFLSTFETFRRFIIDNYHICSIGHFGWNVIGIAFGTAMTVIEKNKSNGRKGEYSYLTIDNINKKSNVPYQYPLKDNGRYSIISQVEFKKLPLATMGFWITDKERVAFSNGTISDYSKPCKGIDTGENSYFLRLWYEVSISYTDFEFGKGKWVPYNKGGIFRRWYGNRDYLLRWNGNEDELSSRLTWKSKKPTLRNKQFWFKPSFSWSSVTAGKFSARYSPSGAMFDNGGSSVFSKLNLILIGGLINSKIAKRYFEFLAPTINTQPGDVGNVAFIPCILSSPYRSIIESLVKQNINISKSDWDSHETSWDFETLPLLKYRGGVITEEGESADLGEIPDSVEELYKMYKAEWEQYFKQLHENEEELNRQFIEIYGLQDELTPDVPLDEITILQQGEIKIENGELKWNADVVMKQLISYAVGCMMGRYSIDKPGLILANQGDSLEQYNEQVPDSRFEPDDDGIIPLMSAQSDFADNATVRFKQWLVAAFGEETLVDNLNFIEASLAKSIDDYFVKDFWKDHKKMYQNRPIYWLFSSKKGAFQCLAYMHRMDAYTAERIRTKYLLPHIEWLIQKQNEMEANATNLNSQERKQLDNISKQIDECREYHDRLHVIADEQIAFDLDDGVVVNYAKFRDVLAKIK